MTQRELEKRIKLTPHLNRIIEAKRFSDLLRADETIAIAFKRLAKLCHPDFYPDDDLAKKAFLALTRLHDAATKKSVDFKIDKWSGFEALTRGDIADLYLTSDHSLFKIARRKVDNDLIERESKSLTLLHAKKKGPQLSNYIPELLGSVTASQRRANVMTYAEGFVSLEEIMQRTKESVEFRHIVWMMNRLLSCLGYVHYAGLVHGAIVPCHILYNLKTHDMRLVDWCYSVESGQTVKAIVTRYKSITAPEILDKHAALPQSDMYMAIMSLMRAAHEVPYRFRDLLRWGVAESTNARAADAWNFQDRWRSLARQEYGEPKFSELTLPVN